MMNNEEHDFLSAVADWIETADAEHACLPYFKENIVANTKNPAPTPKEVARQIRWMIAIDKHPAYVQVYRAVCGWQTILMAWEMDDDQPEVENDPNDPDGVGHHKNTEGGFYNSVGTGMGPYGHSKKGYDTAVAEGKQWAEDEGAEFRSTPFVEEEKEKGK